MSRQLFSRVRHACAVACALALIVSGLSAFVAASPAQAADGSQFVDGNIISDAVFFNGSSMAATDVQAFLNSKVSSCQSGYVCLKDYSETTASIGANPMCAAYSGGANESAAVIITKVGQACGVSQKALLATLEKEQGLVTATAPASTRYGAAMGALCPDTAPCDSAASGFFKQVYTGAYLFKRYTQPAGTGAGTEYSSRYDLMYPVGQTTAILYQVASQTCSPSTKDVYIQNQATHALYVYTPYTPNAAALANMYGTGDRCSAYGNRNFWRNFTDWFGSTQFELSEQAGVYAVNSAGNLLLYRGTGRGTWASPLQVGNGWAAMASVTALGDFDSDGKRDVVALNQSGQLWLYPTDGPTTWKSAVLLDSGWDTRSTVVAAGDFDENGTIDVFMRDPAGDLWLLRGNGSAGFISRSKVGTGWGGFTQIIGGFDWNGDGHTDIIARAPGGDLWAYYGNGSGSWLGSSRIGTGWQGFAWISSAGDFDGDGAQDLVASTSDGRLFLYTGNGVGGWKSTAQVGIGWSGLTPVFGFGPNPAIRRSMQPGLSDINSDGARDVLTLGISKPSSSYAGRTVYSRSGAGDLYATRYSGGGWQAPTLIGNGWNSMVSLLGVGDVTGDGQPDILALDSAGALFAYPTDGTSISGAPVTLSLGLGANAMLIDPGDFDGDGMQDLITRDGNGDLWLAKGLQSGGFGTASKIGNGWGSFDTILGVGDWDGDGTSDVLARTPAGAMFVYGGNGAGGWKSSRQIGVGWQTLTQLTAVGDWNGDGKADIAGRTAVGTTTMYLGNGAGSWSGVVDAGAAPATEMLSGSGSLGATSVQFTSYLGSGRSGWKSSSTFSGGTGVGQLVTTAGDTNGDGQKEIVWRATDGTLVTQTYNASGLTGSPTVRASGASTINLLVGGGDFNGDGLADVVARDTSGNLWLYRGSTGAQFQSRIQIGNGWGGMSSIIGTGDFTGDGKADLLAVNSAGAMYLYAGNGQSGWNSATAIGVGWSGLDVIFSPGDFTGDGISDVLGRQRDTGALYLFPGNGAGGWAGSAWQVGRGWNIFNWIG
ncbi:MAG: FG-GAP repeat domain-containing protein [Microbacteriaceae bacterium]